MIQITRFPCPLQYALSLHSIQPSTTYSQPSTPSIAPSPTKAVGGARHEIYFLAIPVSFLVIMRAGWVYCAACHFVFFSSHTSRIKPLAPRLLQHPSCTHPTLYINC